MPADNGYIEELWIGIKADFQSLQQGLRQSQDEIKSFVGHISASSQQLQKFGNTVSLVSGLAATLGGILNNVFAKFEQSMANTVSVLGGSAEQIKELGDVAREMGAQTVFSASESADAMYYLASAGYNANQVLGALRGTLDLAAATQYDLAETTRITVSALNSFGLESTEATRVSNVFSAIIGASQANMEKLGDSMKYIAPIAAGLGISIEQTSAALGLLYNSGIESSQAGTYLRQGLIRLQAPTKDAVRALEKLGLTAADINPQMHSLVEIIDTFDKAGAGMIDKGDELAEIFGLESISGWQVLIKNGAEAMSELEKKITGTNKASEMAEIQMNTFSGSLELMKGELEEASIAFGEALQPVIRTLVGYLESVIALFNAMPSVLKSVIVTVLALATGLGLIVGPVAILLAQLPSLIAMTTALGVSFKVALGWVAAISTAVVLLVGALGAYAKSREDVNNAESAAVDSAQKQQTEFDLLTRRYMELKNIVNKTKTEKQLYLDVIKTIQEKYPEYFKNIDLETVKYEEAKKAIDAANKSLRENLNLKVAQAVLEDENNTYIENGKRMMKLQQNLIDMRAEFRKKEAELPDNIKKMAKERGFYGFGDLGYLELQMKSTEEELSELEKRQEVVYKNINKQQTDLQNKLSQTGITGDAKTPIPPQQCPEGYYWDTEKNMCLKIGGGSSVNEDKDKDGNKDSADDTKRKAQQLEDSLYDIKKKSMISQLDLLSDTKDKSLAQDMNYLSQKQLIDKMELDNWYKTEKKKLDELGASKDQKLDLDNVYNEEVKKLAEKHGNEIKAINKKWDDENRKLKENEMEYNADHYASALKQLRDYLAERLETLVTEGKKWNDEYFNLLNSIDAIDKELLAPKENKMVYELEMKKKGDQRFGGNGYSSEYGVQLEAYNAYLSSKLAMTQEWSDEYVNILKEQNAIQEEMYNNQLNQARYLFMSIQDVANVATAGIGGGFNKMWSMYIMPKSREAKNELDAIWMAIRDSALRAMQQIIEDYIAKQLITLISKIVGFIAGGPIGATAGGIAGSAVGGGSSGGASVISGAADGAIVKKPGILRVHQDELVVPADIARANNKKYDSATKNGAKNTDSTVNHINLVLNNPVVDSSAYWDSMLENHIAPALDRIKKRVS